MRKKNTKGDGEGECVRDRESIVLVLETEREINAAEQNKKGIKWPIQSPPLPQTLIHTDSDNNTENNTPTHTATDTDTHFRCHWHCYCY